MENATEEVNFTIRCDSVQARVQPSVQWFYSDGESLDEIGSQSAGNIIQISDGEFNAQSGDFNAMLMFGPTTLSEISELFNSNSQNISLVITCLLINGFGNDTQSIRISQCGKIIVL